ncbi:MAG: methylenetetrahydrofolate reductase [Firmicutes bacterium]|nr:methylenetetrahydrofolate reductase [NAD(P)H] [Bacillota bacterium]
MKIIDVITGDKPSLSFEVFPPKTEDKYENVVAAAEKIATLRPDYMSVTYGAGGGTSEYTADIAQRLSRLGVNSMAHLTCVASSKEKVHKELIGLKERGIQNILALRGDMPEGFDPSRMDYHYAYELAREIRDFGGFCIGGACYPETHPESESGIKDLEYLKIKAECGCEFFTTQMFFDNNILYNFLYRMLRSGVDVPVVAGIMPVTNKKQIERIMAISGTALPQRFVRIVDRYGDKPEAMKQAGIAYATEQIIDLYANGINAVHVYSMNNYDVAKRIQENLSEIIK